MEYLLNMLKGSVIMFALPIIFNDTHQVTADRQCGLWYNTVISKNQGETVEMPCILETTLQEGQLVIWRNGMGDKLSECAPRTCSNFSPHAPERVRIITDHKHNFTLSIINIQVGDSLTYHCDFYSSKSSTGSCEATAIALDVTTKDYVQTVSTFPSPTSKEVGSMNNATVSPVNTNLAGETTYTSIINTMGSPFDNTTSTSSISTTNGASVKAKANPVSSLTSTSSTLTMATSDVNVTLSDKYASLSNCYTGKQVRAETFLFWIGGLTIFLTLTLLVVTCCLIIKTCATCFRRRKNSRRRCITNEGNSVEMLFIGGGDDDVDGDNENQRTLKKIPHNRNDAGNNEVDSSDTQLDVIPYLEPVTTTMASTHIHGDSNEFSQTRLKDNLFYPTVEVESKVLPSHNSQEVLHTFNVQLDTKERHSPFPLKIKRTYLSPLHSLEREGFVSSGRKLTFDGDLFSPHFDDLKHVKGHTYMDVYDQDNPFPNMHLCKIGYHTSLEPSRGQDAVGHLPVLSDSMTPPSNERDMDRHIWYTREGDGKLRTSNNNFKTSTLSANPSSFTQRWQERKARTDINFPTPPPLPASRHENRD